MSLESPKYRQPVDAGSPDAIRILTYCPHSYNGRGPAESCVQLLGHSIERPVRYDLVVARAVKTISPSIEVTQALPPIMRRLPWRLLSSYGYRAVNKIYGSLLDSVSPENTIAYFWPQPPLELVKHAKSRGFIAVREMTNCFRATARRILEQHSAQLGITLTKPVTMEEVAEELDDIFLYDYIFASNKCVEDSLTDAGVAPEKIIRTSFGWTPSKYNFGPNSAHDRERGSSPLRVLFVGTIGLRKGVPYLLEAWERCGIEGILTLAGSVDPEMTGLLSMATGANRSVEVVPYTDDIGSLYRSADLFVFPTLEEGGPQVVYEAAGAGLPVVTTPMGQGRIIEHGFNGLLVDAGDGHGLAAAIGELAASRELRKKLGENGVRSAAQFTYDKIGAGRAAALADCLDRARWTAGYSG